MQASQHVTIHQWRSNATATGQKPQSRKQKQCKSNRTEAAKQSPVRGKEHCRSTDRKRDAVSAADRKRAPTGFLVEKETLSLQTSAHHTGRRPAGLSRNRTGCTASRVRPRQSKKKAERASRSGRVQQSRTRSQPKGTTRWHPPSRCPGSVRRQVVHTSVRVALKGNSHRSEKGERVIRTEGTQRGSPRPRG